MFAGRSLDCRVTNRSPSQSPDHRQRDPQKPADPEQDTLAESAHGHCRSAAAEHAGVANPQQFAGQVAGILPALVGIFREAPGHDVIDSGGVSGCSSVTGRGSSFRIEEIRLAWVFPLNALDPVTIS